MDAQEVSSNRLVCIKMITKSTTELAIAHYLSPVGTHAPQDSTNHCVPVLDSFHDPISPGVHYLVMPLLRPYNEPEFGAIGEVVDFATQTLEVVMFPLSFPYRAHLRETGYGIHAPQTRCSRVHVIFICIRFEKY